MNISKFKIILIAIFITLGASSSLLTKLLTSQKIQSSDYLFAGASFFLATLVAVLVIIFISKKGYFMHYKQRGHAHNETPSPHKND